MVQEYLCAAQDPQNDNNLLIRTSAHDIGPLVAAVKREVQMLDADQPIAQVSTMEKNIGSSLAARR
jgi:hypothetical protein